MADLITTPNIQDPDDFYAELLELHAPYTSEESQAINARLVLLLANHIGDRNVLRMALSVAQPKSVGEKR
jgi:hypothetical protein